MDAEPDACPDAPPTAAPVAQPPSPMVACEKCSAKVSDLADRCPQCGHPQPKQRADAGEPHARCEACQTLNLLDFREPAGRCRGCGAPLRDGCADHFEVHELAQIYDDTVL